MGAVEEAEVHTSLGFGDKVPLSLPALTAVCLRKEPNVNDGEGLLLRTFFFFAGVGISLAFGRNAWPRRDESEVGGKICLGGCLRFKAQVLV